MLVLALLTLRAPGGCARGSELEDCEEWKACLADPPRCSSLVIESIPYSNVKNLSYGINGTIPDSIGSLTALTELWITESAVSGTIPNSIGALTALTTLKLGPTYPPFHGSISGTIPEAIGKLTKLRSLRISGCPRVHGTIPEIFSDLSGLSYLKFWGLSVNGTIPKTMYQLTHVHNLYIENTSISGTLSESIGNLARLTALNLDGNFLDGTIPDSLLSLTGLDQLSLRDNKFTAIDGGICAIQNNLASGCDLSGNDFPPFQNGVLGQHICPICLSTHASKCPVYPSNKCNDTTESATLACTCYGKNPTPAPTGTPTEAPTSEAEHAWHLTKIVLCFGHDLDWCGEIAIAWWFAVAAALLYECISVPIHACRASHQMGIAYHDALVHAFTHQCWCCTRRGRGVVRADVAHLARTVRESALSRDSILSWATAGSNAYRDTAVQSGGILLEAPLLAAATHDERPRKLTIAEILANREPRDSDFEC